MGWLVKAIIAGLGGLISSWLAQRRAAKDRETVTQLTAYTGSQAEAQADEAEIKKSAQEARDNSSSSFNDLR